MDFSKKIETEAAIALAQANRHHPVKSSPLASNAFTANFRACQYSQIALTF